MRWLPALLLLLAGGARADEAALPPAPARWVTDEVGFLSPATRTALDARLEAYERKTGHQVIVWIGSTIGGAPLDDWAVRTFAAWGIGRKGHDDGLVLFILADDRKMDIEVGYGLEDRVPDARAKQIISDTLAPALKAGRHDEGVTAAVEQILGAIEGHAVGPTAAPTTAPAPHERPAPSLGQKIAWGIFGLAILVLIITNPRLALLLLFSMMSGRRGGFGGGGYGGGFSGGGGRSGGGGARGSW
jgi:uncharacterized protein